MVVDIKVLIYCFLMIVAIFIATHGCSSKEIYIVIQGPTELLYEADYKDAPGNRIIAVLDKEVKARVIHIRYSKEFMFYKIRTEDGRVGYVKYGDNFQVFENGRQ